MTASLEWSPLGDAAVLRVHLEGGSWETRSAYSWAATVFVDGGVATVKGVDRRMRLSEYRVAYRLLRRHFRAAYREKPDGEVVAIFPKVKTP